MVGECVLQSASLSQFDLLGVTNFDKKEGFELLPFQECKISNLFWKATEEELNSFAGKSLCDAQHFNYMFAHTDTPMLLILYFIIILYKNQGIM